MTVHAMSEPEAFRWIQRAAMDKRTTMSAVAELVLSGMQAATFRTRGEIWLRPDRAARRRSS